MCFDRTKAIILPSLQPLQESLSVGSSSTQPCRTFLRQVPLQDTCTNWTTVHFCWCKLLQFAKLSWTWFRPYWAYLNQVRLNTQVTMTIQSHFVPKACVKYHQATGTQEDGLSVRPWTTRSHRVHLLSNSCLLFGSTLVSARGHLSDMDRFWVTGALKMAISLFLIAVCDGRGARRLDAWTDMQVRKRKRMGSTRGPSTAAWAGNVIA